MRDRKIARLLARVMLAVGIVVLGYCAYVEIRAWHFQQRAKMEVQKESSAPRSATPVSPSRRARPVIYPGDVVGTLDVPRLRLSVAVVEGDSGRVLSLGAGHIPGTALPGAPGNVGIAAHRDTYFRPLQNIRRNDEITVTTRWGTFRYLVDGTQIVKPSDVKVLSPGDRPELTLVTCYPFHFIGSAPKRFVVHAVQEGPRSPAAS
jgi:sortase A